jgi:hypothetical protein
MPGCNTKFRNDCLASFPAFFDNMRYNQLAKKREITLFSKNAVAITANTRR